VHETARELATLQTLIDRSLKRTGPHMKAIIHPGKYSLNAKQVNAHGPVVLMFKGHPDVGEIDDTFKKHYGSSAFDWSDEGVYVRLDADRFFTYSRTPKEFPV